MDFSTGIVQEHQVNSNAIGYHEYCKTWVSFVGETLQCQMELGNVADKYAVAVIKKDKVVRHLMNGNLQKLYFFPDS